MEYNSSSVLNCYPEALALMDETFVFSKGRKISLSVRLPKAFSERNAPGIYCAVWQKKVVAAAAIQRINLQLQERLVSGVLLGGIVTHKAFRRQGIASGLLNYLESRENLENFFILWTGTPAFYQSLGWQSGNPGIYARIQCAPLAPPIPRCWKMQPAETQSDARGMLQLWEKSDYAAVSPVSPARWQNLPLPAESCQTLLVKNEGNQVLAYVIFGFFENNAYLYELCGDQKALQWVLNEICRIYPLVFLNGNSALITRVPFITFLESNPGPAMMVKSNHSRMDIELVKQLYFSYLDRI